MRKTSRWTRGPWPCCGLVAFTALTFATYVGVNWYLADPLRVTSRSVDASAEENVDFRQDVASRLLQIARQLKSEVRDLNPNILLALNQVISQLDPRYSLGTASAVTAVAEETADACGERFNGTLLGRPFYRTGFVPAPSCDPATKPSLSTLVTVLVVDRTRDVEKLQDVLSGIQRVDPALPVVFASDATTAEVRDVKAKFKNVLGVSADAEDLRQPGRLWNRLVAMAHTPYVLIARDVFRVDELARLSRQVYVLSVAHSVGVAGGAFRNETGFWKVGCHLTHIRNYILRFTEGYQYSALDCMLCDHLEGPFMAKTKVLREIKFSDTLLEEVLFEDWFLRLKQQNILAMNCPDVMYFKSGPVESARTEIKTQEHSAWLDLAREWQVDHIYYPSKISIEFSCKELQVTCDATRWFSALFIPTCCMKQVAGALKALDSFAKEKKVDYEIEAGTLLGAVKLRSFLPWDRDGDITFWVEHYQTFYDNSDYFSKLGYSLSMFKRNEYFRLNTPEIILEMWGSKELSTFQLPSNMWEYPTRVKMMGLWIRGEWNPGLFARNRYGPDYLKHVQHWNLLDMPDSWQTYKPGSWKSCPKKAHHACMDQYPTDGSVDLLPPEKP